LSIERSKLEHDLTILQAMAGEMEDYLESDVLFWQMMQGGLPKLTLGGYLLREHRLLGLREQLLDESQQKRLDAAVIRFSHAVDEKIVQLEQKAHRELEARIRQWGEYLKDLEWGSTASIAGYHAAVDTRMMIAALVQKLQIAPYQLNARLGRQIQLLDENLLRCWEPGDFIWPEEWESVYPPADYWWLCGSPRQDRG
jgi:hypothetical protein